MRGHREYHGGGRTTSPHDDDVFCGTNRPRIRCGGSSGTTTTTTTMKATGEGGTKVEEDDDDDEDAWKGKGEDAAASAALPGGKRRRRRDDGGDSSSRRFRSPPSDGSGGGDDQDDFFYYVRFSRVFQRHVVRRRHRCHADRAGGYDEVMRSFQFLDEALSRYPNARVLAPKDLPHPPPSCSVVYPDDDGGKGEENDPRHDAVAGLRPGGRGRGRRTMIDADVEEGGECDEASDIAGMGLTTLCELEYEDDPRFAAAAADDDGDDDGVDGGEGDRDENDRHQRALRGRRRRANDALGTLLSLVSSEDMPRGGARHFFRLDPRRLALAGHTSRSISENHARAVGLLGRIGGGRRRSRVRAGVDDDDDGGGAVGLALDAPGIGFVMRNFPSLCAYDADEVEELVRFLLGPLPETGAFPSVAMIADGGRLGGDGADVDCEFAMLRTPRFNLDVRRQRIDPITNNILSVVFFFFSL